MLSAIWKLDTHQSSCRCLDSLEDRGCLWCRGQRKGSAAYSFGSFGLTNVDSNHCGASVYASQSLQELHLLNTA